MRFRRDFTVLQQTIRSGVIDHMDHNGPFATGCETPLLMHFIETLFMSLICNNYVGWQGVKLSWDFLKIGHELLWGVASEGRTFFCGVNFFLLKFWCNLIWITLTWTCVALGSGIWVQCPLLDACRPLLLSQASSLFPTVAAASSTSLLVGVV